MAHRGPKPLTDKLSATRKMEDIEPKLNQRWFGFQKLTEAIKFIVVREGSAIFGLDCRSVTASDVDSGSRLTPTCGLGLRSRRGDVVLILMPLLLLGFDSSRNGNDENEDQDCRKDDTKTSIMTPSPFDHSRLEVGGGGI
jgi:hypothetical protein